MQIGVGRRDVVMYSGHSIKRGAVQLYRSLSVRDEQVMEIIQMKGPHAYSNYTASYNDCAPLDLPRFSCVVDYIEHANTISQESDWIHDPESFREFVMELWGDVNEETLHEM